MVYVHSRFAASYLTEETFNHPIHSETEVKCHPAQELSVENDIYITDPPYGDAVKIRGNHGIFYSMVVQKRPSSICRMDVG